MPNAPLRKTAAPRRRAPAPAPERILSAALAAFAERGFDGATTREIAADAGVPQGLVTYHFESKQALWQAAVDWVFRALAAELRGTLDALVDVDPATRLRALMKRFVRFSAAHPELHRFMVQEGAHDGPRLRWLTERHLRPLYEASTTLIREAAPGSDAAHLHYLLLGASAHLFAVGPEFERVTGRDPVAPEMVEAHASAVAELVLDAALARAAREPARGRAKRAGARGAS
jgi:AcrR family transcriptional regulator